MFWVNLLTFYLFLVTIQTFMWYYHLAKWSEWGLWKGYREAICIISTMFNRLFILYKKVIPTHITELTILYKALSCKRVELLLLHTTWLNAVDSNINIFLTSIKMALYCMDTLTANHCSPPSSILLLWFCMVASSSQCSLFCLTPSTRGSSLSDNTANDW